MAGAITKALAKRLRADAVESARRQCGADEALADQATVLASEAINEVLCAVKGTDQAAEVLAWFVVELVASRAVGAARVLMSN